MAGDTDKKRSISKRVHDFLGCYLSLSWYYGREFRQALAFLERSRTWSREQVEAQKVARLRRLLRHAETKVPFYRHRFAEAGVSSRDFDSLDDLQRFPVLTKDDLINHHEELKADDFVSHRPILTTTSGTTGKGTRLYRSKRQESWRQAVVSHYCKRHGVNLGDRIVYVGSPRDYDDNSPVATYDRIENALWINSYHAMAGRQEKIIDAIREFKPTLLYTLPNMIYIIAEYGLRHKLEPIPVRLILSNGEFAYPHLAEARANFFPGEFLEFYANRENTISAWGRGDTIFTEISEYCHLEIADNQGTGDLLSTSLHNFAFPLIRLNAGDLVTELGYRDNNSARPGLKLLGGRGKDLLVSKQGLISPHVFSRLRHSGFYKLRGCQLEQIDIEHVIVRVVVDSEYDRKRDEPEMLRIIDAGLLHRFKLEVEYIDELTFTKRGKFKPVISDLATRLGELRSEN